MSDTPVGANLEQLEPLVGDVVVYKHGNLDLSVEFFKVITVTPKTVKLRQLESKDVDGGVLPKVNKFKEARVFSKAIKSDNNGKFSIFFAYGSGKLWSGGVVSKTAF